MKFSLLVTSYGRAEDLERFFHSVGEQRYSGRIEVIFVDQNVERPESCALLQAPIALKEVRTGGRTPLSKARNLGLRLGCGEIFAFPDDDCWYEPELLAKIASYFKEHPEIDCICTNVYDPERKLVYGKRPVGVSRAIHFGNLFRLGISVGVFVRKTVLERAGAYFDESLGAGTEIGSGEETELLARLLSAGCKIQYEGGIQVYHPVPVYCAEDQSKSYKYGVGTGFLYARLLRAGHIGVLSGLAEILVRSLVGVVVYAFHPASRRVYWNRFKGIVCGFARCKVRDSIAE
jgi:GT2 family glycosyltransferase